MSRRMRTALELGGIGAVVVGLAVLWWPLAVLVAGALLILVANLDGETS